MQLVEGNGPSSHPIYEKGSYEYETLRAGVKQSLGDQEVVSWGVFQVILYTILNGIYFLKNHLQ